VCLCITRVSGGITLVSSEYYTGITRNDDGRCSQLIEAARTPSSGARSWQSRLFRRFGSWCPFSFETVLRTPLRRTVTAHTRNLCWATLHGGPKWVPAQNVQISTNRISRNCKNGPKGFTLGPNPNFFTSHMTLYVAQIWRQNIGPKQGKWAKVFLGPNYKGPYESGP
jgi:hypothetical protein